jgi:hypothetical protein
LLGTVSPPETPPGADKPAARCDNDPTTPNSLLRTRYPEMAQAPAPTQASSATGPNAPAMSSAENVQGQLDPIAIDHAEGVYQYSIHRSGRITAWASSASSTWSVPAPRTCRSPA